MIKKNPDGSVDAHFTSREREYLIKILESIGKPETRELAYDLKVGRE